jgi:hypothetical protein
VVGAFRGLRAGEEVKTRTLHTAPFFPPDKKGSAPSRVSVVVEAKSGAARMGWPPAKPQSSPDRLT